MNDDTKPAASKAQAKRPVRRIAKPAVTPRAAPAKRQTPRVAKPVVASRAVPASRRKPAAPRPAPVAASRKPVVRKAASATTRPATPKKTAIKPAELKKSAKPVKAKKVKLVRDSFTMPETEYAMIASLKARCLKAGVSAKKSEILRAAVAGLAKLGDAALLAAIRKLDVIKTGRPVKQAK